LALEPTLSNACAASGAERVEHHRVMKPSSGNHQLGWSRYRSSQDQIPSKYEAGLDASDNIHVPAEGEGRIFFLTSPFIGRLEGSRSRARRTRGAMGIESILISRPLPDRNFGQNPVIDTHRYTSRNQLRHLTSGVIGSSSGWFRTLVSSAGTIEARFAARKDSG
jgi:hypothetical protein